MKKKKPSLSINEKLEQAKIIVKPEADKISKISKKFLDECKKIGAHTMLLVIATNKVTHRSSFGQTPMIIYAIEDLKWKLLEHDKKRDINNVQGI